MAAASVNLVLRALLLLAFALSSLAPAAHAQETPGLDAISAEYRDMVQLFYKPVDPHALLQAGWSALSSDAARRGAPSPGPLPDLSDDPEAALGMFSSAYQAYVASLPSSFPASAAAADVENAIAESVREQHTHYLPPAVMKGFLSLVSGGQQSIGPGVQLGNDPPGLITAVAPGGPAELAGLQPGDVIIAAGGKDVTNGGTPTLAAALIGPSGSTVELTIQSARGEENVVVTRGPYYFPPLQSNLLPGGVGYLRLSDFVISGTTLPDGTELLTDLDQQLDELDAEGAQSWILDLRDNGGGSVQTADELLGRFLPDTVRSVRESDERGHLSYEIAAGRTHARQLPMAVLINGGSASASEITAAALRDAHRAVLVGQHSAGAVASSELLPLPGGAGLQVAVAAASAPDSNTPLDGVGVAPEVAVGQSRTLEDYRSGHDPQIEAAIAALISAPVPPAVNPPPAALAPAVLDELLESALPDGQDLPANDRLTQTGRWQRLDYIHPNEVIDQNGGSPDPVALQHTMLLRGYQGTVMASYGSAPGDLPSVSVNIDMYSTAAGAHAAASTNDLPQIQLPIDAPTALGDETVAYRGAWLAAGSTVLVWRRGRVVFSVAYADVPGLERTDTLTAISQLVDTRAQQMSLPYLP